VDNLPEPTDAQPDASDQDAHSSWRTWARRVGNAAIGAVVLLIGGAALYGLDFLSFHQPSAQAERARTTITTSTPPSRPEKVDILINRPEDTSVPRCVLVSGTATVPDGLTIWVAQHGRGDANYFDFTKVTFDPSRPDRWQVKLVLGGEDDTSKEFVVYAFALDAEATRVLEGIGTEPKGSFFYLSHLPVPQGQVESESFLRNDHDTVTC
jgi:hypothetical protein